MWVVLLIEADMKDTLKYHNKNVVWKEEKCFLCQLIKKTIHVVHFQ